jgi:hypothetical protein
MTVYAALAGCPLAINVCGLNSMSSFLFYSHWIGSNRTPKII